LSARSPRSGTYWEMDRAIFDEYAADWPIALRSSNGAMAMPLALRLCTFCDLVVSCRNLRHMTELFLGAARGRIGRGIGAR
jgi:hypothetical protein